MGLFKKKEFKNIDTKSRMIDDYPAFYEYYENSHDSINAELSQCDDNTIEFRLPIMTFGRTMGQLYIGLAEDMNSPQMYTYAISSSARKTQRFNVPVNRDLSIDKIEEYAQQLMSQIILDPKYQRITTGGL